MGHGILPQRRNTDLPGATCGKAPVFGNVICVECTTGPFPTCKTFVCDKNGNNCKETMRINTQALTPSRTDILSWPRNAKREPAWYEVNEGNRIGRDGPLRGP
jgi:hypothetical protein